MMIKISTQQKDAHAVSLAFGADSCQSSTYVHHGEVSLLPALRSATGLRLASADLAETTAFPSL